MNILRNNQLKLLCSRLITSTKITQATANQSTQAAATEKKFIVESLDQRQLVRVKGEDVIPFLQGLTTNDIRQLQSSHTGSLYTMFLNKAGRVMYDAIVYKSPSDSSTILIECDQEVCNELMRHLKLYRVRRKIQIDSIADELKVWCVFQSGGGPAAVLPQMPVDNMDIINDPRLPELGYRLLATSDRTSEEISKLLKNLSNIKIELSNGGNNYRLHRYKLGVAEGMQDMPPGKQFPLEANCDLLNGVSFNKGCYIGQELTARVHHTGVIRKRHMPVILKNSLSEKSSYSVCNDADAKVGNILGSVETNALALIRIEKTLKSKELTIDGKPCSVEIPKWWPPLLLNNILAREEA
ncbi:putative transferase CAF17 homolog, mitochondrial [Musca vetustissima]|uniref:putative transferase CAF17 homolog, mitochondrial n=1 Tax=Musca vetustissima TaxID=27455 RepID=UPI002AB7250A|nr:putative transferase CAF17 homolog, mitochondrial [Musca vetustissima]